MPSRDAPPLETRGERPIYTIPRRQITALEHPMLVMDVDKAIRTLGLNPSFTDILKSETSTTCVPLYIHPDRPTDKPLMSYNAASNNVLLKVTVPRRTGRKRKRGSDEPFQGYVDMAESQSLTNTVEQVSSRSNIDEPIALQRRLRDTAGRYKIEAVGNIKQTHRYRGMVDFQYSTQNSRFMKEFTDKIIPGDVSKLRAFSLQMGTSKPPNVEMIPPPVFTHMTVPFAYNYSQNPYVREVEGTTGFEKVVNVTARVKSVGHFIQASDPIPLAPRKPPDRHDPALTAVLEALGRALEDRPIWTRRSAINRLSKELDPRRFGKTDAKDISAQLLKKALHYVGYQFKGGPWRDALIKYGVDPRTDPKYRQYQTMVFRLRLKATTKTGQRWQDIRKAETFATKQRIDHETSESHIFDGKNFSTDGKVWQVCDITDPLLAKMLNDAPNRPTCDVESAGWYHRGLYAKVRAIMKHKIRAIQFGRVVKDSDFGETLGMRDESPDPQSTKTTISMPLPDLGLTAEERAKIHGIKYKKLGRERQNKRTSYNMPSRFTPKSAASPEAPAEDTPSPSSSSSASSPSSSSHSPPAQEDDDIAIDPRLTGTVGRELDTIAEEPEGDRVGEDGSEEGEENEEGGEGEEIEEDEEDEDGDEDEDDEEEDDGDEDDEEEEEEIEDDEGSENGHELDDGTHRGQDEFDVADEGEEGFSGTEENRDYA